MAGTKKIRFIRDFVLGPALSLGLIIWLLRSVEEEEVLRQIRTADFSLLILALVVMFGSYLLRAYRWPVFFATNPPVFLDSFRCLIMGFLMNNLLPARMGEFIRAHLGGRVTKQSRASVLATIAGERLADGLMISVLFVGLFTIGARSEELDQGKEIFFVAILFGIAAIGTVMTLIGRRALFSCFERLNKIFPGHLSTYTLGRVRKFIEGLVPMLEARRLLVLSLLSLAIWLIELFVYYLVASAFHEPLSLGGVGLFLAAVNFSSLIPAAPGGIGVIEAFATLALRKIGVNEETALAMVAVQHLIQYIVILFPGMYFFLYMGARIPKDSEETDEFEDVEGIIENYVDVSRDSGPNLESALVAAPIIARVVDSSPSTEDGDDLDLSVVIPAFNEENRLPKTLLTTVEYLESRSKTFEVIVVDDGSKDQTPKIVRQFERLTPKVRLLICPQNRGKGFAVRLGVMNSRGRRVLFCDADGATPFAEIERLESAMDMGAQVAIGSRAIFSHDTKVETAWYRKIIGRIFNGMVNIVLLPGIADTQCGFKMFTKSVARYIFSQQRADRFSFDVEILYLARKAQCKIAEVPVNWSNVAGSKVNLVRDSFQMFIDVLRFRFRDVIGGYERAPKEAVR